MAANSLGPFSFISARLSGGHSSPPLPLKKISTIQRPGVSGTGFIDEGSKGDPFELETFVDAASLEGAVNLFAQYAAWVGTQAPVTLIWSGIVIEALYVAIAVRQLQCQKILAGSGGLSGNPQAILKVVWTLCPVALDVAPGTQIL